MALVHLRQRHCDAWARALALHENDAVATRRDAELLAEAQGLAPEPHTTGASAGAGVELLRGREDRVHSAPQHERARHGLVADQAEHRPAMGLAEWAVREGA